MDSNINYTMPAPPVVPGEYVTRVTYSDGMLFITLRERISFLAKLFGFSGKVVTIRSVELRINAALSNDNRDGLKIYSTNDQVLFDTSWPESMREEILHQINRVLHATKRNVLSFQLGNVKALLVVLIFGYLYLSISLAPRQATGSIPAAANAAAEAQMPQQEDLSALLPSNEQALMSSTAGAQRAFDQLGSIGIKAAVAQANKVILSPGTGKNPKSIVVWSDVLCPHCRNMEDNVIAKLPKEIGVTIIPVAFKDSRPLASYVLCGSTDVEMASRWMWLMAPTPKAALEQQCAAGPVKVDENSILFLRAGLAATPTIMSKDGELFTGDPQNLSDVLGWVSKGSK